METTPVPGLLEWLKKEPAQPKWLIQDFLPEASLAMVSGPRKVAMKTWQGFDASLSVALGSAPSGSILTVPHEGKRVLTIEEEGTGHDTRSRILKLLKGRGINPLTDEGTAAIKKLEQNYFFWHHPRVKLDNPNWVKLLRHIVKEEGISLVVLDAITYMTSGDENSKQDMAPVNDALFALRQLGACVLYLVHTNKQAQREDADPDLDVRGSSVLLDAYDVHFALRRHHKEHINLLCRYRDFEEQRFKIYWDFKPDQVTGTYEAVTEESDEQEKFAHITAQLVPTIEYNTAAISKGFGLATKEAAQLLNSLVNAGILVPTTKGNFVKKESL